jgi:hypothetical protein
MTDEAVARAIVHGVARGRFVIALGPSMPALARLHSLGGPLLHRFWFHLIIAQLHGRASIAADVGTKRA